jgi:hypothetical protein
VRLLPAVDGGELFDENLSKTEGNRRIRPAFSHIILKFLTRVEKGGKEDRRPQHASWRVGVSC